jgi:hypothetical protein
VYWIRLGWIIVHCEAQWWIVRGDVGKDLVDMDMNPTDILDSTGGCRAKWKEACTFNGWTMYRDMGPGLIIDRHLQRMDDVRCIEIWGRAWANDRTIDRRSEPLTHLAPSAVVHVRAQSCARDEVALH